MADIIYSNNPNDDSVQVQIEGKYHKTSLVRSIGSTEVIYQNNPNINKVLFTGEDGKKHTAILVKDVNGGGGDQHNLGYYADLTALQTAHPTATAGDWAIVGTTDTVWIWDEDTSAWKDSDQKGQVTSVNGRTGAVTVQETLVSGTNIKSINGNSILGSGNLQVSGFLPFPAGWTTNSTTKALCDDIAADTTTVKGSAFLGEVTCSDLPAGIVNSEINVYINDGTTAANKVIILELTSGNVAPYRWIYVYWNGGTDTSGWKTWQETLVSGTNIKTINGESLLGSGNLSVGGIPQYTTMPTATSSNVGEIAQYSGTTDATYTNGYFYKNVAERQTGTATISQTTGSGLTDLTVDAATFESQISTTGNYDFEAVEEQAEINFTDENGWEVELDANGIIQMLDNGGNSYFVDNGFDDAHIYQENGTDLILYISSDSYGTNEYDVTSYVTVLTQGSQDTTIATLSSISRSHTDWYYDNNVVDLADYGITYEGTPIDTDVITVAYTEGAVSYVWERTDVQPAGSGGGIEWAASIDKPANYSDNSGFISPVWNFGDLPDGNYEYYFQTLRRRAEIDSTLHIGTDSFVTFKVRFCIQTDSETNKHIQGYMAYVIDGDYDPRGDNYYMLKENAYHAGWLYNNDLIISNNDAPFASVMYAYEYASEIKGMFKISKVKNIDTGVEITPTGHLYDYQNNESDNWQYIDDSYFYTYNLVNVPETKTYYQTIGYGVSPSFYGYYFTNIHPLGDKNYDADMAELDLTISGLNNGMPTGDTWHAIIENGYRGDYKARIIKSTGDLVGAIDLIVGNDSYTYIVPHLPAGTNITGLSFCYGFKGSRVGGNSNTVPLQVNYNEISGTKVVFDTVGAEITPENLGVIVQYNEEIPNVAYTKGYFYQATGTVVTVQDDITCEETDTSIGATITCTNVSGFINALATQFGYSTDDIKDWLRQPYSTISYTAGQDAYWNIPGFQIPENIITTYFSFSPALQSGDYIVWEMTFTPEHQEVQNPAWTRFNTQPSTTGTTGTLVAANWSSSTQTITVNGVTASNNILVSPAPASAADWASAGILCTAQGTDSLTFTCTQTPSNDITVNVLIFD